MKRFFLLAVLLCPRYLAAYSSISEYTSDAPAAYSSIGGYSSTSNKSENIAPLENKIDAANDEIVCENLESIEEPSKLPEDLPIVMVRGPLTYHGQLKIDDDGYGPSHGDPLHCSTTALQRNGQSLNSDYDSYVVAPRWLLAQGVKVGERADVTAYFASDLDQHGVLVNSVPSNKTIQSIVGDVGPARDDVGEISIKAALDLGFGIRDISGIGPIPTFQGSDADIYVIVTYYPSGSYTIFTH
jgi:hypothetical protein